MDQAISREYVEETTELALQEKSKLVKSLSRLDMIGFTVCALVGLDTLGTVASNGAQGFTWLIVLAVVFVLPYALAMAEVGSAFTQEGGPYEWAKMAFGRFQGAIAAVLYWVTNPLWVGGSLAFIATEAWNDNIFKIHAGGAGDYLFKFLFIWFSIGVAIVSLKRGKWIPNLGALMRVVLLGLFTLTTIIYAIKHGAAGFAVSDLKPTGVVFLALVPLLLFNYVGFELQNGAAEEMEDPQRDVPLAILRSGITGVLLYAIPIFAILVVLPAEKVTGIGGFLDAVTETFSVYGGASSFLLGVMTICFVGTLLTSGAVWMIGSGPDPGRGRLRRRLPGLLRRLQPQVRHAGARQHDVGHLRDHLHGRRRGGLQRWAELEVRRGARHRDLDDADLLPVDLPGGHQAALHARPRLPSVSHSG